MIMGLKITLCEFFGRGEATLVGWSEQTSECTPAGGEFFGLAAAGFLAPYRHVQELLNHGAGLCLYALRVKCQSSTPSIKSRLVSSKLPPQIFAASSSVISLVATALTRLAQAFVVWVELKCKNYFNLFLAFRDTAGGRDCTTPHREKQEKSSTNFYFIFY